jgi:hypothetical protein
MKPKSITVDIDTDGSITIEGHGFSGPSCAQATAFLEKALGVETAKKIKPEFNERAEQVAQQKAGQ